MMHTYPDDNIFRKDKECLTEVIGVFGIYFHPSLDSELKNLNGKLQELVHWMGKN